MPRNHDIDDHGLREDPPLNEAVIYGDGVCSRINLNDAQIRRLFCGDTLVPIPFAGGEVEEAWVEKMAKGMSNHMWGHEGQWNQYVGPAHAALRVIRQMGRYEGNPNG